MNHPSPAPMSGTSPAFETFQVIGITGGMASGKSTVARLLAGDSIPILDADAVVHDLMVQDAATIAAIAEAFPESFVDGAIRRAALAEAITQDPSRLAVLETILHPRVRHAEEAAIAAARDAGKPAIILDIPLLFETGAEALCDCVIAVQAPEEMRRARAFARPGMSEEKWQRLVRRQWSDAQRAAKADAVMDTSGNLEDVRVQLDVLKKAWGLT